MESRGAPPGELADQTHLLRIRHDDGEALISSSRGLHRIPLDGLLGAAVCSPAIPTSRKRSAAVTAPGSRGLDPGRYRVTVRHEMSEGSCDVALGDEAEATASIVLRAKGR